MPGWMRTPHALGAVAEDVEEDRVGIAPDDLSRGAKVPLVDFYGRDNQDSGPVSEETIRRDYVHGTPQRKAKAKIYRAYIPASDVPMPTRVRNRRRAAGGGERVPGRLR